MLTECSKLIEISMQGKNSLHIKQPHQLSTRTKRMEKPMQFLEYRLPNTQQTG